MQLELLLGSERPDGARARHCLTEVHVDRRTGCGLDAFQLSRGWDVEALDEVVEDAEWYDDGQEDGGRVADDDDGGHHREDGVDPRAKQGRQDVVNGFNVAREAVQDSTDRCRIEE